MAGGHHDEARHLEQPSRLRTDLAAAPPRRSEVARPIAQSVLGVTVLVAAITTSPWIGALAILVLLGSVLALLHRQRRRGQLGSAAVRDGSDSPSRAARRPE